jgi:hypothetical protein
VTLGHGLHVGLIACTQDVPSEFSFLFVLVLTKRGFLVILFIFVVVYFRQYLAIVFKDKPLELWDVRTCTLLREMSKNFPAITALVSSRISLFRCACLWQMFFCSLN